MASDCFVVARRWDGLGGRLHAILNAWSLARALDLEFRFVWPRDSFPALHDPREIFDKAFLARFEVAESTFDDCRLLGDPTALSLPEARDRCRAAAPNSIFDVRECFEVLRFADEPAAAAAARFRTAMSEIAWSRVVRALVDSVSTANKHFAYSAIHARAGDIVEGDWRQFVPVEKYTPTTYVEFAVEVLAGTDASPVVVLSDNDPFARYLRARSGAIRLPSDLVLGYAGLSDAQRALADIVVMSRARNIVGPRTSAFSRLAAHLGDLTILSVGDLMTEDDARRRLRDGISRAGTSTLRRDFLRRLLARDICWFLDVFSDNLTVSDHLELARRAKRCDPDFCGALNRLATALAFAGKGRASANASSTAQRSAALAEVHADPLIESLATSIAAGVVTAIGARKHGDRRRPGWPDPTSVLGRLGRGVEASLSLTELEERIGTCEALKPFQTPHHDVMANLRFQHAVLAWLTVTDRSSLDRVRKALGPAKREPLLPPGWRPPGFISLRRPGSFAQTLRNLEIATIRIAHAIASSLTDTSTCRPQMGNVDSITTSPSGLRWLTGWAYDPDRSWSDLRVGLFANDGCVSGGTTFLPRPDVAATLDDPSALKCGFAFPVPESVRGRASDLQAGLRISRPG